MNTDDLELISSESIEYGAILQRVINAAGVPYTIILVDGIEVWSTPTSDEKRMLEEWEKEGKSIVRLYRKD